MLIYKDVQLVWTAKTTEAPIFIDVASFSKQQGLIVSLSDTGFLQISYLGTSPPKTQIAQTSKQEMNYERMDQEHQQLLGKIMSHENEEKVEPTDKMSIGVQVFDVEEVDEYIEDTENVYMRGE
jgi:hypothetical protein